jgi:hypothetical protein
VSRGIAPSQHGLKVTDTMSGPIILDDALAAIATCRVLGRQMPPSPRAPKSSLEFEHFIVGPRHLPSERFFHLFEFGQWKTSSRVP